MLVGEFFVEVEGADVALVFEAIGVDVEQAFDFVNGSWQLIATHQSEGWAGWDGNDAEGMRQGLHQSRLAGTEWARERDDDAGFQIVAQFFESVGPFVGGGHFHLQGCGIGEGDIDEAWLCFDHRSHSGLASKRCQVSSLL